MQILMLVLIIILYFALTGCVEKIKKLNTKLMVMRTECNNNFETISLDRQDQLKFNKNVLKVNDLLQEGFTKLANKRTVLVDDGFEVYIQTIPVPKFTNMSLEHGVTECNELFLLGIRKLKEKKT